MDRLSVSPRLRTAIELAGFGQVAADIGCDHGKLGVKLLRKGLFQRIIATDISASSLEKCRALIERCGLDEMFDTRCGNGLALIGFSEADTLFILGLGGKQIWNILSADISMRGAGKAVLSPMKDVETLRRALFTHSFHVIDDRIVQEDRRLYQVFSVRSGGSPDPLPPGWPEDCFEAGYKCFVRKDPLLPLLVQRRIAAHRKSISIAAGSPGETILKKKLADLLTIQSLLAEDTGI